LTTRDLRRLVKHTGDPPSRIVRWVDRHAIDLDDEPEAFVQLRPGKRVMVLRHERGRCRYLGKDDRCTIYGARPLGCRLFPFDPKFSQSGNLVRLNIVQATESCPYELDGKNDPDGLRSLKERYDRAHREYYDTVAAWNHEQRRRRRAGKAAQTAGQFLAHLGF
jgi:Fe-S-cluster containining protein